MTFRLQIELGAWRKEPEFDPELIGRLAMTEQKMSPSEREEYARQIGQVATQVAKARKAGLDWGPEVVTVQVD